MKQPIHSAYDSLGRRKNANDLAAFNLYGYNARSEVTSAARYWGTDTGDTSAAVDGQQYAYAFDPTRLRPNGLRRGTSATGSRLPKATHPAPPATRPTDSTSIRSAPFPA